MSGLEGLAALGLACSIFQVVSFGRETLALVKSIYRDGTIDASLVDKSTAIKDVASNIIAIEIRQPSDKHEQELFNVTKKCTGVARDLQEEIAFLVAHSTKGSLRETLRTAVKMNWRKRRLERLEKDLADAEQVMQSALLAWVFKSLNTANMNIDHIGENLRHFVIKYEQRYRHASELVTKEALQVREVIAQESRKTELGIRTHIAQTSAKAEKKSQQRFENHIETANRKQRREKLLQSLKFPGMNERANQIKDAHARTFRWLLASEDKLTDNGDEKYTDRSREPDDGNELNQEEHSEDESSKGWYAVVDTDNESGSDFESEYGGTELRWSSFTDWLRSDLNIYWIMGKPGSGKSTLMKFISSQYRTKILLRKWRHDAIIASHYFWRPGALLQRSIKGMLCSIAYQLVFAIPDASEHALRKLDPLSQKDATTDWSVPELRQLCLDLIKDFSKPLCLLIDGLDECGPEDDHQSLLEILERMRRQSVKIIASSRNEPVFERRFRHEPQLRMQDLMVDDLRLYTMDRISHKIPSGFSEELVQRAEGVFLWLILAIQSINRGVGNGESITELRTRMESLPKRLADMYNDMWERLNDDASLYRKSAALYFRLVIAAQNSELRCVEEGLSTMEMMLASPEETHHASAESSVTSASQLLEECEGFRERVEVRCAGLLSMYRRSTGFEQEVFGETENALAEYADKSAGFRFIHRSAYDFLVDTIEGQSILRHDETSSEDFSIRFISASLQAAELLFLILGKTTKRFVIHSKFPVILEKTKERFVMQSKFPSQRVKTYLADLSSIADVRDGAVGVLFSCCYKLFISSGLILDETDTLPTRIAAFFGVAARFPNLNRYSTYIIERQLDGSEISSAVLLSVVANYQRESNVEGKPDFADYHPKFKFPLQLAQWLLHLPEIDVNLKCPLLLSRGVLAVYGPELGSLHNFNACGPLDHIKASPFTRLLGFGLESLDWRPVTPFRHWHQTRQFIQLVSDFTIHGADLHSTVFLAFRLDGLRSLGRAWRKYIVFHSLFFQFPGWNSYLSTPFEHTDDSILCVMAFEARAVIQRMLASIRKTDSSHDGIDNDGHTDSKDTPDSSDYAAAISFLSDRCQEHGCEARARVIGFLQPHGNLAEMPYRHVSDQDSAELMEMIWECIFSEHGVDWGDIGARCRKMVARSPFSRTGFRDFLRATGYFDDFAAHKLALEYYQENRAAY